MVVVVAVVSVAAAAAVDAVCLCRLFDEPVSSNKRVHYDIDVVRGKHMYYHCILL